MKRTIAGRVREYQRSHAKEKKRLRSAESEEARQLRLETARVYKKRKSLSASLDTAEFVASQHRLQQALSTNSRNIANQEAVHRSIVAGDDEQKFFAEIDAPLSVVCASCGELVPPSTTRTVPYNTRDRRFQLLTVQTKNGAERGLIKAGVSTSGGKEYVRFCARCDQALSRHQVPKFSRASGIDLTPIPQCLAILNPMESRMIGLGVCFTTCFCLGHLGQSATRGNAINFWNNAYDIVTKLPRPASRCGVIRLKRSGSSTRNTYYHVRPWLLRRALTWLRQNNPIYREILIDEDLLAGMPSDSEVPSADIDSDDEENDVLAEADEGAIVEDDGAFDESFVLQHTAETQREDENILDVLNGRQVEEAFIRERHDQPINEYTTKLLMQSCFPTLFPHGLGGFHPIDDIEPRKHEYKLAEYCCHLMTWHDRRFITHPTFKFFCLNLVQRRQIDGLLIRVSRAPRESIDPDDSAVLGEGAQTASPSSTVRVTPVANPNDDTRTTAVAGNNLNVSQHLKDLRPFFRSVRGTGLYWANVRDDVMTMIGNPAMEQRWPTFFVTLSAADTVWPDFFRVCDPTLTLAQAGDLSPAEKRRLLNDNPDLAARHFHRRFQAFFKHILCGRAKPLGEIVDFFWRIEFQRRGSPHVHALLWIKDAPDILQLSKTAEGIAQLKLFADKFVSCMRCQDQPHPPEAGDPICHRPPPTTSPTDRRVDLGAMVERVQLHVCSGRSSCQRNGACRFGYPKPLREATDVLCEVKNGTPRITFEHKRDDSSTNNYNAAMLSAWRANMDVKIIGNAYGAAEYTAAYVSKAEPDSVRFRKTIEAALRKLPNGVPHERLLKRTASAVLAIREVSAQETMYILSNTLCLFGKSRTVLKVKVSRHDRRFYRFNSKSKDALATTTNKGTVKIEAIEHAYMQRPRTQDFANIPYREFCESYEVSADGVKDGQHLERWKLLDDRGFIKARQKKQVVRPSPHYHANEEDPDYCYAQLFLHRPWRTLADLPTDDDTICAAFMSWKSSAASPWIHHIRDTIERADMIQAARDVDIALPSPNWSLSLDDTHDGHTVTSPEDGEQRRCSYQPLNQYSSEDIVRARHFIQDVVRPACRLDKLGAGDAIMEPRPLLYPTDDQNPFMSEDQWKPFCIWMNQSRKRYESKLRVVPCRPIQMVVSGEGGTGKSWLIRQIIQDIQIVFGRIQLPKRVLLTAHQGSAAYLIGGRTLTSAFCLPGHSHFSFRSDYIRLVETQGGPAKLRRLQNEYEHVHLIVIDEYGVVSSGMLHWIDERLREIFPSYHDCAFGGRDVLFTGDPGQLGPVKSSSLSTPEGSLTSNSESKGWALWESIPLFFTLRQQNRGSTDPEWYNMLTRVRAGDANQADLQLINSRVAVPPPDRARDLACLAYRNVDVDAANESAVRLMDRPLCAITAYHDVQLWQTSPKDTPLTPATKQQLIAETRSMTTPSSTYLPVNLTICEGSPVVLSYNMEQQAGLCNGSRGNVYDIIPDDETTTHQPIVLVQMKGYSGPSFIPGIAGIIPVTSRTAVLSSKKDGPYRISRTALPLRLGFATTIHKIQGQTCDAVAFNPTHLTSAPLAYVALSRVRHRSDIFITSPLKLSQLQKTDVARKIDKNENDRVGKVEKGALDTVVKLLPNMKSIAYAHNMMCTSR